jgi:RHS repeat-associated protein
LPGIDRPFALVTDSVPGTGSIARFFHQDELGNVIGLTRGNNIEQHIEYEPWGEVSSITGTVADTSRLRWKGLFWEGGNTSLYYARNRWYDPQARRFTSQDPSGLAGGLNQYAFGHNDPTNYADPFGLEDTRVCSMETDILVDFETGRWSASDGCKTNKGGRIDGWSVWGVSTATMFPGFSSFGIKPGEVGGAAPTMRDDQAWPTWTACMADDPGIRTALGVLGASIGVQLKAPSEWKPNNSTWGSLDRRIRMNPFLRRILPGPDPDWGPVVRETARGPKYLGKYGTIATAAGGLAFGYALGASARCAYETR